MGPRWSLPSTPIADGDDNELLNIFAMQ
jgi:hypothetical protein